jgi:hypothetical protein
MNENKFEGAADGAGAADSGGNDGSSDVIGICRFAVWGDTTGGRDTVFGFEREDGNRVYAKHTNNTARWLQ